LPGRKAGARQPAATNLSLRLPLARPPVPDDRFAPSWLAWARRLEQKRAYDAFYAALAAGW